MAQRRSPLRRLLAGFASEGLISRLGLLRDRARVAAFRGYIAEHSYGGTRFKIRIGDGLGQGWYDHDWPALAQLTLLESHGRVLRGARVFDLGAHQGLVAMMLADAVGAGGQVVAVEATAYNADLARENAAINRLSQIEVLHAAASDGDGELRFAPRANGHVADDVEASVAVPAVCVDSLTSRYGAPDLLLIDVEGFEIQVLRGASATLREHAPDVAIEVHVGEGLERWGTVPDLLALLPHHDLLVSVKEEGPYLPIDDPAAAAILGYRFQLVGLARQRGRSVGR